MPSGAEIQAFVTTLPDKTEDMLNAALSPAVSAVEQLTIRLEVDAPLVGTVSDATGSLTQTVGDTLSLATNTVTDLATGLLRSPQDVAEIATADLGMVPPERAVLVAPKPAHIGAATTTTVPTAAAAG